MSIDQHLTAAGRVLRALSSAGGATLDLSQIAEQAGFTSDGAADADARNVVSVVLSTNMRKHEADSEWAAVYRVSQGQYAYVDPGGDGPAPRPAPSAPAAARPEPFDESVPWEVVGRDGDVVVLKAPGERFWVARPLRNAL